MHSRSFLRNSEVRSINLSTNSEKSTSSAGSNKSSSNSVRPGDDRHLFLTSQVFMPAREYHFSTMESLFPHESIRRNALRGERALQTMDIVKHPWKMGHFHKWLVKFLFGLIMLHEETKEFFIKPAYYKLGETQPFGNYEGVKDLLEAIEEISQAALDLATAGTNEEETRNMFQILCEEYLTLVDYLFDQYQFEEQVWAPIYEKHGEEVYFEIKRDYIAHHRASANPHSFLWHVGSCFYDMGLDLEKYPSTVPTALPFDPFMTVSLAEAYALKMGSAARKTLIPQQMKQFLKWKLLIDSCTGTEDIVDPATDYYNF